MEAFVNLVVEVIFILSGSNRLGNFWHSSRVHLLFNARINQSLLGLSLESLDLRLGLYVGGWDVVVRKLGE
jgi:hypothetical protein